MPSLYGPGGSPWDLYKQENKDLGEDEIAAPPPRIIPVPPAPQVPRVAAAPQPVRLPLQAPGSGTSLSTNSTVKTDERQNQNSSLVHWPSPVELQDIIGNLRALPEIQAQEKSQALNRELFRTQLAQNPNPDLATPLANWGDLLAFGKYGDRKPLENPKDKMNALREYAKQLQDDQRDISNTILSGAQKTKMGTDQDNFMRYLMTIQGANSKAQDPNLGKRGDQDINNVDKWLRTVQRDDIIKKMPGNIDQLKEARHMLESNSPIDAQNFKFALLKGLGIGKITDYELRNEQGGQDYMTQIERTWDKKIHGYMDETDRKNYMDLIDDLIARSQSAYDQHRMAHVQNGVINYKIPQDKALVGVNSLMPVAALGKVPTGRPPEVTGEKKTPTAPQPTGGGDAGMDAFLKSQGK